MKNLFLSIIVIGLLLFAGLIESNYLMNCKVIECDGCVVTIADTRGEEWRIETDTENDLSVGQEIKCIFNIKGTDLDIYDDEIIYYFE